MGLFGGSSSSDQTNEGDLIFNNSNQSAGGGSGPLKNFNVGRSNTLKKNNFNIQSTDHDAIKNAMEAAKSIATGIGKDTGKTAREAVRSGQDVAEDAIFETSNTASEAIESSENQARLVADVSDNAQSNVLDLAEGSIGEFSELMSETQATSERATMGALDKVFQATQSEGQQNTNELIKFGIGGAVVVGAVFAIGQLVRG